MLVGEMALEIRLLAKRGKGLRAIAREIGVSRNTVRRYLRDGDAERYRQRPRRSGKLASFDDYIAKRLAEAAPDRLAGTVLLRELRERGYTGGYTILKDHLMLQRPLVVAAPVVRFETAPGEQMQVDWAVIRRGADRLSVFIATLGWSRAAYIEFVGDERLETLLSCHEHAFLHLAACRGKCCTTICAPWCRNVTAMAMGSTAFRLAFLILRGIAAFALGSAVRIARRARAKWSGSSATCAAISGCLWQAVWRLRAWSWMRRRRTSPLGVGCGKWRMPGGTPPLVRCPRSGWSWNALSLAPSRHPMAASPGWLWQQHHRHCGARWSGCSTRLRYTIRYSRRH